jgi:hypothetical protein
MTLVEFQLALAVLVTKAARLPPADVLEALEDECEALRGTVMRDEFDEHGTEPSGVTDGA